MGKRCGQLIDALVAAGEQMTVEALAATVGVERANDLRRRHVARLVEAGVAVYDEEVDMVHLAEGWCEALDRERTMSGEVRTENLEKSEYERQREARKERLAELRRTGKASV